MATQQEYYDQIFNPGKESVDKIDAERRQRTEQGIAQYNSTIDQHVQAGVAGYQRSIDQAPLDALEQKEDNALREAINRKIVSENMANMGITDSGLNRTQQTALTLQRGNADAEVDRQTKEYVNQLQMVIDEVMLEGETKKADYANKQRTADSDWYDAAILTLEDSAREGAATMYAADQEAEATVEAARIKAQQEAEAAQLKAQQQADNNVRSYITKRMADGVSYDVAAMEAYTVYGTGDEQKDAQNRTYLSAYQKAINAGYDETYAQNIAQSVASGKSWDAAVTSVAATEVGALNVNNLVSLSDGLTIFGKAKASKKRSGAGLVPGVSAEEQSVNWDADDWNGVIDRMIDTATKNLDKTGRTYSDRATQYAIGSAIGAAIKNVSGKQNAYDIYTALYNNLSGVGLNAACTAAGINING